VVAAHGRQASKHAHGQDRTPARTGRLQRRITLVVQFLRSREVT
jgi:hypothetical protein